MKLLIALDYINQYLIEYEIMGYIYHDYLIMDDMSLY